MYFDFDKRAFRTRAIEWEIGADGERTGRWRRGQYYADKRGDKRVPGKRAKMPWKTGEARRAAS